MEWKWDLLWAGEIPVVWHQAHSAVRVLWAEHFPTDLLFVEEMVSLHLTYRCPDSTRPETMRPCLLPCKKDCIVTPFSEWTRCPTACQPGKPIKREQNFGQLITSMAMRKGWRGTRIPLSAFQTSSVHAVCLHLSQLLLRLWQHRTLPSKGSYQVLRVSGRDSGCWCC